MRIWCRNTHIAAAGLALMLSACDDPKREIKELKTEVQLAYGKKDFQKALTLSQKGLTMAAEASGPKSPDTLYFVQAVSENTLAQGNMRGAMAALKQEIAARTAAGQPEQKLQARRTLLIKLAEENNDKMTAADQAVAVAKGIDMGPGKTPQPVYRTETAYPPDLYQQRVEGDVEIGYSLDANGAVTEARVVRSTPPRVFDQAALESFRKWRFTPMLDRTGRPVSASGQTFTLAFRLGRP